jgi:hypothetical protein
LGHIDHRITSSALTNIDCGIVMPSADLSQIVTHRVDTGAGGKTERRRLAMSLYPERLHRSNELSNDRTKAGAAKLLQ